MAQAAASIQNPTPLEGQTQACLNAANDARHAQDCANFPDEPGCDTGGQVDCDVTPDDPACVDNAGVDNAGVDNGVDNAGVDNVDPRRHGRGRPVARLRSTELCRTPGGGASRPPLVRS